MTYTMVKKSVFKYPTEKYLNIVKKGYKNCRLDNKFLNKALLNNNRLIYYDLMVSFLP